MVRYESNLKISRKKLETSISQSLAICLSRLSKVLGLLESATNTKKPFKKRLYNDCFRFFMHLLSVSKFGKVYLAFFRIFKFLKLLIFLVNLLKFKSRD